MEESFWIRQNSKELIIDPFDADEEMEISIDTGNRMEYLYLTKEEVIELRDFLNKQLKNKKNDR